MSNIPCPYCKATGWVVNTPKAIFCGLVTFGLMNIFDKMSRTREESVLTDICESCNGTGWLTQKKWRHAQ